MKKLLFSVLLSIFFSSAVFAQDNTRVDVEAFVTRFYQNVLERDPDSSGLDNWVNALLNKTKTGADVANGFIFSEEFKAKGVDNEEYLNILYKSFFDREADSGGFNNWINKLINGASRLDVLNGFLVSTEFKNLCEKYNIESGLNNINIINFVTGFYQNVLEREPDKGGLDGWVKNLVNGTMSGSNLAKAFIFSTEFKNKNIDEYKYVTILYHSFFNREPDNGGFNNWINKLSNGTSKEAVLDGFLGSAEFSNLCKKYNIKVKLDKPTLPDTKRVIGIDVSKHNGDISWESIKDDGISFAFIKATEGYADSSWPESSAFDSMFIKNMNNAISNGILVGAYHFAHPEYNHGIEGAKAEAKYFVSKIKDYYLKYPLLPPVIDIETSYGDKSSLTTWVLTLAREIEKEIGIKPILYMSESYSDSKLDINKLPYKLWIAKYISTKVVINSLDDIDGYQKGFRPNKGYTFWQFSSTGNDIDGVNSEYLDKDIFSSNINELKSMLTNTSKIDYVIATSQSGHDYSLENEPVLFQLYTSKKDIQPFIEFFDGQKYLPANEMEFTNLYWKYTRAIRLAGHRKYRITIKDYNGNIINRFERYIDVIEKSKIDLNSLAYKNYNTLWIAGYAPKRFYNYDKGEYSELDSCSKNGVEALGNCTWYAQGRVIELGYNKKLANKFVSNASKWASIAKNNGIEIDNIPTVGAIAQHSRNTYGHVAIVEKINNDGTIDISESSYAPCSSSWNFEYRVRKNISKDEFTNYIHLSK